MGLFNKITGLRQAQTDVENTQLIFSLKLYVHGLRQAQTDIYKNRGSRSSD
jgi:hypothetical protein